MDFPREFGESGIFIRLKDGQSVTGVFRGDPYDFKQHWKNNKSVLCEGDGCPLCQEGVKAVFRFRINFVTQENGELVVKIFEQGRESYKTLKELHKIDYDLEKTFVKIARTGSGPRDTAYSIRPIPKWQVPQETDQKLSTLKLHDLVGMQQAQDAPNSDEDIPF